jgi:hypothetical protein
LEKKNSILAKASQVSDVAHGPLVFVVFVFVIEVDFDNKISDFCRFEETCGSYRISE